MDKHELVQSLNRMIWLTRQYLAYNPSAAQEYYEKVQHLNSVLYMVSEFEKSVLLDLDVD